MRDLALLTEVLYSRVITRPKQPETAFIRKMEMMEMEEVSIQVR
jgi:hypothetical protein